MRRLILILVLIFVANAAFSSEVLSFKSWKNQRVQQAKSISSEGGIQAKNNVEIARELTPNDYFVMYLSPMFKDDSKAIKMAAQHMTQEEVAQIFASYAKQLEKANQPATTEHNWANVLTNSKNR